MSLPEDSACKCVSYVGTEDYSDLVSKALEQIQSNWISSSYQYQMNIMMR